MNRTARHFSAEPARRDEPAESVRPTDAGLYAEDAPRYGSAQEEIAELRDLIRHLSERLERLEGQDPAYGWTEDPPARRVAPADRDPGIEVPETPEPYWADDRYADEHAEAGAAPIGPLTVEPADVPGRRVERRPQRRAEGAPRWRRRAAAGVVWLALVAAVGVAGWWVWSDLGARFGGPSGPQSTDGSAPPGATGSAPAGTGAAPPAAPLATVPGETAAAPAPDASDSQVSAVAPELGSAPPAPAPAPVAGPAVPAAPTGAVEAVPLDWDLAPLPENASAELRQLARSALEGDVEAQHLLGNAYALGDGVEQQFEIAAFWYRRASEAGQINARYNLAVLTERGWGVPQDSAAAFALFHDSAQQGHPSAQVATGLAFADGRGVAADQTRAADWFRIANANGSARGAYHLGRLYEDGLNGEPDLASAAGWYRVAAEAGDEQANQALARVIQATGGDPDRAPPAAASVPVPDSTPEPVVPGGRLADDAEMTRELIAEIQTRLNGLGYDAGPVDGLMGARTRQAIREFQGSAGMTPTGEPSGRVLNALRETGG